MTHLTETQLNDYVDDALTGAERDAVEAHLAECAACRSEEAALRSLLREAAALPAGIAPQRDLWPGIARRIEAAHTVDLAAERARREARRLTPVGALWAMRYSLAAAAILLIALTSVLTTLVVTRAPQQVAATPGVEQPATELGGAIVLAAYGSAEQEYTAAVDELVTLLEQRRDRLAPETIRVLEENLAIIDAAIRASREALEADPWNPELGRLINAAYEKKMRVLRQALRLTRT